MIPPNKTAIPDKKYLHHRVMLIHGHGNDVLILHVTAGNLLLLGNLGHAVQKLPVLNGFFKFHRLGSRQHLLFQFFQNRRIVSIQKSEYFFHRFCVFFLGNIALAGRRALVDMVIETWPFLALHFGQLLIAGTDTVQLVNQINRIFYCSSRSIGAIIFRLILVHLPCKQYPWEIFLHRHFDKRIGLVIHEHGVVFGPVLLNQITLQHQRFQLRIRDDVFKPGNMGHHLLNLHALVPAGLKILPYPVFQRDGFSNVNNGIFIIMHQIDAWLGRELFQFFFYIEYGHLFLLLLKT